jgi:HK97 family phage major capsid protein
MKIAEMHEKRKALMSERDSILASSEMTVEQESRGHEVANELQKMDGEIRAAQLRERFASYNAMEKAVSEGQKRDNDWTASTEYRDQFVAWARGGREPERREVNGGSSSGVLIPKVYQDGISKYLDANTVVRNLADLRTGVKGYTTLRYNNLQSAGYTGAWATNDQQTGGNLTAAVSIDPGWTEVPIVPIACLPYTQISRQSILQSDFDLEAEIIDTLQRQLAKNLEAGYVGGPGVAGTSTSNPATTNGPYGLFKVNANTNITAATAASGTATRTKAIAAGATLANLTEMRYSKLPASAWGGAAWVMPQDFYAAVAAITVNSVPLFVPSADKGVVGAAPFTLMGLPVYVTEYTPTFDTTATTGVNTVCVLGNIQEAFSVREWTGMSIMRDEISQASSARIRFYGMQFANSAYTRVKNVVQLQVTNA